MSERVKQLTYFHVPTCNNLTLLVRTWKSVRYHLMKILLSYKTHFIPLLESKMSWTLKEVELCIKCLLGSVTILLCCYRSIFPRFDAVSFGFYESE